MSDEWPIITKDDIKDVLNLINNKRISIIDGSGIIAEFESNFSKYIERRYCLVQNNGTSTLHAAFFALGLKKGDEILVPSYTWHSSVSPMLNLGIKPLFCEINPNTLTIDPKDIETKINKRTKAILVVHLWGMPAQMDEIIKIAKENNLFVIEDCSHAYGSLYNGKKVGTFGDISCFSMQAHKLLAAGEGGIFCTDNKDYYEKALILGHFGRLKSLTNEEFRKYSITGLGFKYRANPLSISLANSQLRRLNKTIITKNINIRYFESLIKNIPRIKVLTLPTYSTFRSYYEYRFIYENEKDYPKKDFITELNKRNVPVSGEIYCLLHQQKLFNKNPFFKQMENQNRLPVTEKIYSQIIRIELPFHPNHKLMDYYSNMIKEVLEKKDINHLSIKKFMVKQKIKDRIINIFKILKDNTKL